MNKPVTQVSPYELIGLEDDRVMTLAEFAAIANIHTITLRRLVKKGQGPPITMLSERRKGIIVRYGRAWLKARTTMPTAT